MSLELLVFAWQEDVAFEDLSSKEQSHTRKRLEVVTGDHVEVIGESGEHHGLPEGTRAIIVSEYTPRRRINSAQLRAWEVHVEDSGGTFWVYDMNLVRVLDSPF